MITLEFSASTPSIARASALAAGMRVAADYAANSNKKVTSATFFWRHMRGSENTRRKASGGGAQRPTSWGIRPAQWHRA